MNEVVDRMSGVDNVVNAFLRLAVCSCSSPSSSSAGLYISVTGVDASVVAIACLVSERREFAGVLHFPPHLSYVKN